MSLQKDHTGQYLVMLDGNFDEIPGLRQKLALHFANESSGRYYKRYRDIAYDFIDFRSAGTGQRRILQIIGFMQRERVGLALPISESLWLKIS